ncbi:hypothetical protein [Anaeromyxobacter diazotrophicus]|uniref:Uncharacterized protein n=1 Tax=Anaeromyxobacter diazotrophicus TaxID=2590199 RepID=A0A7I9VRN2_9BACT|nr:hypothetical protein [Anaeromyxobacter diazotrophicus]GEJ59075.1 hypothetical protein AMYX_38160 [Anaeromyxobacter diazotrophicus]
MAERRGGVVPGSDALKSALRWLSEQRTADPAASRLKLIDEAALRFDLAPNDVEFLAMNWKE